MTHPRGHYEWRWCLFTGWHRVWVNAYDWNLYRSDRDYWRRNHRHDWNRDHHRGWNGNRRGNGNRDHGDRGQGNGGNGGSGEEPNRPKAPPAKANAKPK